MKLLSCLVIVGLALAMLISVTSAESELWEEDDKEVLVRTVRGAKSSSGVSGGSGSGGSPSCRYTKGQWSDCDPKNNVRTRSLTLKKGDKTCEQTKLVTKKCKKGKACRYEKGTWSSCIGTNMTRVDSLKPNADPTCEKSRRMTKRCKPETNTKKTTKDRSNKKASKQQ